MKPQVTLRKALTDPDLLGSILAGPSWRSWRIFQSLTQREREPGEMVQEFAAIAGRRGGKSRATSVLVAYIAGLCDHPALVPGERGIALVIAPDTKQATIILDYVTACFEASPILSQLIESRTATSLRLTSGVDVEVKASNFRTLRGPTYVMIAADEIAFFHSEGSANPDHEIINACRPGLATTSGPLFMLSSPYARKGLLWDTYRHWGATGDKRILVAHGSSRLFNSTLPQAVVDRAMERDPASAKAEYLAQFRTDIETFVSIEVVRASVNTGRYENPPSRNTSYVAFCDPSGGSRDAMTLAIAHGETHRKTIVLDCVRECKPPFSPEKTCEDFAKLLKAYRITSIKSDRYGGLWPTEMFSKFGITCTTEDVLPKSALYQDLLALLHSGRIELLDNARLVSQLVGLERRTSRTGRDVIDHPPGAFDDVANAVAGVAAVAVSRHGSYDPTFAAWQPGFRDRDRRTAKIDPGLYERYARMEAAWRGISVERARQRIEEERANDAARGARLAAHIFATRGY